MQQALFQDEPVRPAARVLVDGLNDMVFDYAIPEGMQNVTRGSRVEVPLRNRSTTEPSLIWYRRIPNGGIA